ncbi:uncharacterized protein (DUF1501 family) [Stenotrophomonas sp. SORGH_AS321]|nr:uncharacterized protein (DUF1501 family) [Stenotrophomonas sp. SORGH_AS_0321]
MSTDPSQPGRREVLLGAGAALALGLAGRGLAAASSPSSQERRMSTLVIRNARITTLDPGTTACTGAGRAGRAHRRRRQR